MRNESSQGDIEPYEIVTENDSGGFHLLLHWMFREDQKLRREKCPDCGHPHAGIHPVLSGNQKLAARVFYRSTAGTRKQRWIAGLCICDYPTP